MGKLIKKIGVVIVALCLLSAQIIDLGLMIYFKDHFMWGTFINDTDVSCLTVEEAKEVLEHKQEGYELTIIERKGKREVIKGEAFGFCYKVNEDMNAFKKELWAGGWPFMRLIAHKFQVTFRQQYDLEALKHCINELECSDEEKMEAPEDAYIGFNNEVYEVLEGREGTLLDEVCLEKGIIAAVEKEDSTIELESLGCYKEAEVGVNSALLISTVHTLQDYVEQEITYDFGDQQEKIDGKMIRTWLLLQDAEGNKEELPEYITTKNIENRKVVINEEAVRAYIEELGERYDTVRKTRQFKTTDGRVVEVPAGDYGWKMDREEESSKLLELLNSKGCNETRQPIYKQVAYCRNSNDIGDSYVEVDLTHQHLWFYKEGRLVTEGDIVSGMGCNAHATPAGVFSIDYKQTKAILRGPGYACPVSYWMPFYDGMGIHDATWRGRFGGTIYMYDGSHGCLNASLSLAAAIYEEMEKGIPVVCYH